MAPGAKPLSNLPSVQGWRGEGQGTIKAEDALSKQYLRQLWTPLNPQLSSFTAYSSTTGPGTVHLPLAHSPPQVIPIYGRGGNEDPRCKVKDTVDIVPARPAGQRPLPVLRSAAAMQQSTQLHNPPGLGILPTLFGIQNNTGGWEGGWVGRRTPCACAFAGAIVCV